MNRYVKKSNLFIQKRVIYTMGKRTKGKSDKKIKKTFHNGKQVVSHIASGLLGAVGIAIFNIFAGYAALPGNVSELSEQMPVVSKNIADLSVRLNIIGSSFIALNEKSNNHQYNIEFIMDYLTQNSALKVNIANDVSLQAEINYNEIYLEQPKWSRSDVIAFDFASNKAYTAEDLESVPLLIPYMENNQEVYFFGQFNKNNHWDGRCLINVYEHEKLIAIMEALYTDGELIEYKQVQSESINGKNVWIVSDRKREGSYNSGETCIYEREHIPSKNFTINTAEAKDIYDIEDFLTTTDTSLISYYFGNTSDGKYNDETGHAFLIKYAEDGTILTLYQGCFKNGSFHDNTYNAWKIARNPNTGAEKYLYFKGVFQNGNSKEDNKSITEYEIPLSRIFEIVQSANIQHEMNWYKY